MAFKGLFFSESASVYSRQNSPKRSYRNSRDHGSVSFLFEQLHLSNNAYSTNINYAPKQCLDLFCDNANPLYITKPDPTYALDLLIEPEPVEKYDELLENLSKKIIEEALRNEKANSREEEFDPEKGNYDALRRVSININPTEKYPKKLMKKLKRQENINKKSLLPKRTRMYNISLPDGLEFTVQNDSEIGNDSEKR